MVASATTAIEPPLDPGRPIIDPHVHIWNAGPVPDVFPPYAVDDYAADRAAAGHDVRATVYVECTSFYRKDGPEQLRPVGETETVRAMADACAAHGGDRAGISAGIVALADFTLGPAVAEVLDAHIEAGGGRVKAIRQRTSYDVDNPLHSNKAPGMLADPALRAGLAELGPRGLHFEAMVLHPQIGELTDLARAFPDLPIVLNHLGAPMMVGRFAGRRVEVFDEWSRLMADLADCPNMFVKLGGMNMDFTGLAFIGEAAGSERIAARQRDFVLRAIELFGPYRCMFESNYPVDKVGIDYGVLWNVFKRIAQGLSEAERHALFFETANRIYRLGLAF